MSFQKFALNVPPVTMPYHAHPMHISNKKSKNKIYCQRTPFNMLLFIKYTFHLLYKQRQKEQIKVGQYAIDSCRIKTHYFFFFFLLLIPFCHSSIRHFIHSNVTQNKNPTFNCCWLMMIPSVYVIFLLFTQNTVTSNNQMQGEI